MLFQAGAVPEARVYEAKANQANLEFEVLNSENNLEIYDKNVTDQLMQLEARIVESCKQRGMNKKDTDNFINDWYTTIK